MITFVISAVIVCAFSLILKAVRNAGTAAGEKMERVENIKSHLHNIIGLEAMGFYAQSLDTETGKILAEARKRKLDYMPDGVEPCTIKEVIETCAASPDILRGLAGSINNLEYHFNIRFIPDISEEVKRYKDELQQHEQEAAKLQMTIRGNAYKTAGKARSEAIKSDITPYYIEDQLDALDNIINGLYAKIDLLEEERNITFNHLRKLEIDNKINRLKLSAAKKEQEAERLRNRYLIK